MYHAAFHAFMLKKPKRSIESVLQALLIETLWTKAEGLYCFNKSDEQEGASCAASEASPS